MDPKTAEVIQPKVGKFSAICVFDSDVDTVANSIRKVLLSTAEGVLGRRRKKIQSLVTMKLRICATRDVS